MPRDIGRNPRKGYPNHTQTIQMCIEAEQFINAEIAASPTGELERLKDKVFDHLVIHMPWWDPSWVDYPGFCDYDGIGRKGAWACITLWWSKQNPGMALREVHDERIRRPGVDQGVWIVISSWKEALAVVQLALDDNASRLSNTLKKYETLAPSMGNKGVVAAMRSAPVFVQMMFALIEAATHFSELFAAANSPADLHAALGWTCEDDAIDAVEARCKFRNRATRDVGRELWAVYP